MALRRTISILAAMAALWPGVVPACSCLLQPDWTVEKALASGTVFAEATHAGEETEPASGGPGRRVYMAEVHRAIGLDAGGTIRIETAMHSAACGITLAPGEPRWLALQPLEEGYGATLCAQQGTHQVTSAEWQRLIDRYSASGGPPTIPVPAPPDWGRAGPGTGPISTLPDSRR